MVVLDDIEKLKIEDMYLRLDGPFRENYRKAKASLGCESVVFLNGSNYVVVPRGDLPTLEKLLLDVGITELTYSSRKEQRNGLIYLQKDDLPEGDLLILDSMVLEK